MSKPLTTAKRERMFQAWCEEQNYPYVVRTVAVCKPTVVKYRKVDNWDARLQVVKAKAIDILDDQAAEYTAEQLKIIKNVKNVYLTCLVGKTPCPHCKKAVPVPKLDPKFADIEKIIRLEEFMRGKPDSRPDIGRTLDALSDNALIDLYNRLSADIVGMLQVHRKTLKSKKQRAAVEEIIRVVNE